MTEEKPTSPVVMQFVEQVWSIAQRRRCQPRAVYRLEFHKEHFSFRDAIRILPYLARLGISHIYASPYFQVTCSASHGYATVDYSRLNPELGTEADYQAYVNALHHHGMGQILDVVPNHMSAAAGENRWWTDVLEHGSSSPYAAYFDIDWQPVDAAMHDRLLLPILGENFGSVLEKGELQLACRGGQFFLSYYSNCLPIDPTTYPMILDVVLASLPAGETDSGELLEVQSILTALKNLPVRNVKESDSRLERVRETTVIQQRLAALIERSGTVATAIDSALVQFNGISGTPSSYNGLEQILDRQVYRLSRWKSASDEINYRRFFDVNELVAICTERTEVFDASHQFIFELLVNGAIDGLRIDHVDGLYAPRQYLWRLQWGYLEALAKKVWCDDSPDQNLTWNDVRLDVLRALQPRLKGPSYEGVFADDDSIISAEGGAGIQQSDRVSLPLYVVVEKILGPNEPLPGDWPIAGTSGYDALNQINGLFINPAGFSKICRNYQRFSEVKQSFEEIVRDAKRLMLDVSMSSELQLLAHRLKLIAAQDRHSRDFTLNSLMAALSEMIIYFPIYRTYSNPAGISDRDRTVIQRTIKMARRRNPAMDAGLFDFVREILLWEMKSPTVEQAQLELFVGRFQQVTSPVMAKGVEDTSFYRWIPLASVNEVGAHPVSSPVSVTQFHAENEARAEHFPEALICTSTHDTKRSEDVRARLNILSEIPDKWRTTVAKWSRMNRHYRTNQHDEPAPTHNDEYLFYQSLVGVWPTHALLLAEHEQLVRRLQQYIEKAIHEAKLSTSWLSPNPDYESAMADFVRNTLKPESRNRFLQAVIEFNREIVGAARLNSVSTALLKLTIPGVPDIYQGQELWDESLVDPDNRRPVDYDLREQLLKELDDAPSLVPVDPDDPRFKLFVIRKALAVRQQHHELFHQASVVPLNVTGALVEHFVAFSRAQPSSPDSAIVIAPRMCQKLLASVGGSPSRFQEVEGLKETFLECSGLNPGTYRNEFTGEEVVLPPAGLSISRLLGKFPLALLTSPSVTRSG